MVTTGTYRFDQGWIDAAIGLYVLIAAFGIVVFRPAARLQREEAAADPTSAAYASDRRADLVVQLADDSGRRDDRRAHGDEAVLSGAGESTLTDLATT